MPFTKSGLFTKTGAPARVLVVESNPAIYKFMQLLLEDGESMGGIQLNLFYSPTLEDALRQLKGDGIDAVICDLELPDSNGVATFTTINRVTPDIPIVVITAEECPHLGVELTRQGAEDYIVKGSVDADSLIIRLRMAFERWKQRQIRKERLIGTVEATMPPAKDAVVEQIKHIDQPSRQTMREEGNKPNRPYLTETVAEAMAKQPKEP